ncbi:MAG: glycosyltransferase family 39 protein [Nitrososphaerales archaeon]|nr:glycosyltransferase family 39 protein [Nitrososphaerales archaeon]
MVEQSYWMDELGSMALCDPQMKLSKVISLTMHDTHPLVYNVMLWLWLKFAGYTEVGGRSMSALLGTIGLVPIYYLGKELFNKKIGVYATLISGLNAFLIQFSQETRSYALLFLLTSISYLFFFRVIKNERNIHILVIYIASSIVMCYTHYYGIIVMLTQLINLIIYLYKDVRNRRSLISTSIISALIIAVSISPLFKYIILAANLPSSSWVPAPSVWDFAFYGHAYTKTVFLDIIFLFLIFYGIYSIFYDKINNNYLFNITSLVVWISFGLLLPFFWSVLVKPILILRATIIVLPGIIVLISLGLYYIKSRMLKTIILTLIIIFSLRSYNKYNSIPQKEQWREVLNVISESSESVPVYDIVYSYRFDKSFYAIYAEMLNLDIKVLPFDVLKEQYFTNKLPKYFWVVEAHSNKINSSKILTDNKIRKVNEVKYLNAGAAKFLSVERR